MINMYLMSVYTPLNFLGTMWRWIRQSMVDVEQIFGIFDINKQIPQPAPHEEIMPIRDGPGRIEFKNVHFKYSEREDEADIIHDLSFTVEPH